MTAIYGRRLYGQYGRYSPLGSLVRTLLASSRWYSPARMLRWDAQTICSKRITYTERSSGSPSTKSARVLSVRDMPSSRLLFRLVPSERPTGGTGFGLLPTAMTQGLKRSGENGRTEFYPLELLPTPTAIDSGTGRVNKSQSQNAKERPTIAMAARMKLLPTPNAVEGEKWTTKYNPDSQMGKGLTAMAVNGLLLTPGAADGMRANFTMESLRNHNKPHAERSNLSEQIAHKIGGGTSQLNPLFVAEMMNFPLDWLVSPFLGGGRKP